MDPTTFKSLIEFLNTKKQATRFLEKIENFSLQGREGDRQSLLQKHFTVDELEYLPISSTNLIADFDELYKQIKDVKVLKITTAIHPSVIKEQVISRTIREADSETFLIEWIENASLIGGASFEYNGKLFDNSLQSKIGNSNSL